MDDHSCQAETEVPNPSFTQKATIGLIFAFHLILPGSLTNFLR
jgi:hypothetical protein